MELIIALATLIAMIAGIGFWFMKFKSGDTEELEDEGPRPGRGRRGAGRMQVGRRPMPGRQEEQPENPDDEDEEGPLLNRKDQRAADKKAEREERKAARAQAIEESNKRLSDKYEKRWDREREQEEKFEKEEEEARKLAEEKAKAEEEEFMKWKDLITVEDEGEERSVLEGEGSLEKFLTYIKMRKVVELEALGSEFQLDAKTIIKRLEDLLE